MSTHEEIAALRSQNSYTRAINDARETLLNIAEMAAAAKNPDVALALARASQKIGRLIKD